MAAENKWGAERIRGELLELGIAVSKRTVQRHMRGVRNPEKPPQDWKIFLANHAQDVWACDFIRAFDALFRPIFAFFIVEHESREVVHFNVTRSPSDAWVAQQLREAHLSAKEKREQGRMNNPFGVSRLDPSIVFGRALSDCSPISGALY